MRWNFLEPKKNKSNALKLVKEDDRDDDSNESMYGDEILMFVKQFRHVLKSKRRFGRKSFGENDENVFNFKFDKSTEMPSNITFKLRDKKDNIRCFECKR